MTRAAGADPTLGAIRRALVVLALLAAGAAVVGGAAGCQASGSRRGGAAGAERSVALARVIVDNRTPLPLAIGFRYAVEPGGEVEVGQAAPGEVEEMAPVPAQEPIILFARGDGFERRLPPRSFRIDEEWTWVIRTDSTTHD